MDAVRHAAWAGEQNKAENKYDTRALEAGYLARGQSHQAVEVMQAMQRYENAGVAGVFDAGVH